MSKENTKVGLILCSYNRPALLKECLESLRFAGITRDMVVLVDDHSDDPVTLSLIDQSGYNHIIKKERKGIKHSLLLGFDYWFRVQKADVVINLDGDAKVSNDFLPRILDLKKRFPDNIVSGFNTTVLNRNPIVEEHEDYFLKKYASGINMCVNKYQFERYLLPALNAQIGNWDFECSKLHEAAGYSVVVAKPSLCQHLGTKISSMGHISPGNPPDEAEDFKALRLPDVTLVGISTNEFEPLKRNAEISTKHIEFGAVKLLQPENVNSKASYNQFVLKELVNHIETPYFIIFQPDSAIINYRAWTDNFYEYDYIGAPWLFDHPEYPGCNVGNGGASWRSRRLHEILQDDKNIIPKNDKYIKNFEEDHLCSKIYRPYLEEKYNIKFAPIEIAEKFSIEAYGGTFEQKKYKGSFMYHGWNVIYGSGGIVPEDIPRRPVEKPIKAKTVKNANRIHRVQR